MPSTAQVILFFQAVSVLAYGLTGVKLFTSKLHRRYRLFFAYLLFAVPYMVLMAFVDSASQMYGWIFLVCEPVLTVFSVLIVLELFRLVFEDYKGLYTLGRWAMLIALLIAAAISVVGIIPLLSHFRPQPSFWITKELRLEAYVDVALVIFILLIHWFLSRYPIRLSRNVLVYTGVYSVFFLSNAVGLLLWLFLGFQVGVSVNACLIGVSSACAVAWWLGLSAKGEEVKLHAPVLRPGSEEKLLMQLDALNATLAKISRN
jgi:hypothetical protein